jgi:thiol-disulfide isomerase/thioredoxin
MDLAGSRVALADFKGKYVLIHFWATWSPAATADLRSLRSLHENYRREERLAFVSVNFDSQPELAKSTLGPLAPDWPQVYAGPWNDANALQTSYGLRGLPEALLVQSRRSHPGNRTSAAR